MRVPLASTARCSHWFPAAVVRGLCLVSLLACSAYAGVPASTANHICAANADPCVVDKVYDIANGSVLDFQNRTVTVTGSGQFNFANGSGSILCGPFTASTSGATIDANGAAAGGGTESGAVMLQSRRQCSTGQPKLACVGPGDCQPGPCGVRRCSLESARLCNAPADCQLGTCGLNKRCSGSPSVFRCSTNADCDLGICPAQLTCAKKSTNPINCSTNSDCDFGTCSVGSASITMGGSIVGNSASPASITLRAADNVTISKLVNLSSSSSEADGGSLTVEAMAGSLLVTGKLTATGGGQSQGGSIELFAGTDVTLSEEVNVVGGDFDGGGLDVFAGRDLVVNRSVLASSSVGAGFGGEIVLEAGRDLIVNGVSSVNKTVLETNGHTNIENFAGDGGTQELTAGRNLTLNINTRMLGTGSQPDGQGGRHVRYCRGKPADRRGHHRQSDGRSRRRRLRGDCCWRGLRCGNIGNFGPDRRRFRRWGD